MQSKYCIDRFFMFMGIVLKSKIKKGGLYMEVLRTEGLKKYYGEGSTCVKALDGIDFAVEKGEFVSIIGTSGSGKSTLLNMIGGLDQPTSGTVTVDGKNIFSLKEEALTIFRRRKIGFVFQNFNLIDELNIEENVELPLRYLNVGARERKERVETALKRMNIQHRAKHFPQQLSGGQQQRAAIARAIVARPELILADEPTGNLDSVNGKEVMKLLTELNQEGATIVMVTHSQHDAAYTHHIIDIFDGKIVEKTQL